MERTRNDPGPRKTQSPLLLAYIADLELEIDRLRKKGQLIRHEMHEGLKRMKGFCAETRAGNTPSHIGEIERVIGAMGSILRDTYESNSHHPAYDQVVGIAVRPLVDQVFRWQQRLQIAPDASLRLELEIEHIEWFPARLRHILDNLVSNALRFRDPKKSAHWVTLALRVSPLAYEFRLSDNGVGIPADQQQFIDLISRSAAAREAGIGVGLSVVRLLVEQSGGTLEIDSGLDQGSTFVVVLPRYDIDDYLT
jgi:signal transduction histidine kinase